MVSKRLGEYFEYKGVSIYSVENTIDVSRGSISKPINEGTNIGSGVLEKILNQYEDLNALWLMTGKGNMLVSSITASDYFTEPLQQSDYLKIIDLVIENEAAFMKIPQFQKLTDSLFLHTKMEALELELQQKLERIKQSIKNVTQK